MEENTKMVSIPLSRYKQLLNYEIKMDMLEASGVDNWEWYGDSLNPDGDKSYSDYKEENDKEAEELWIKQYNG